MNTLQERIRWVMQRFNLSQYEMARLAGVKQPTINRWANGVSTQIRAENATAICASLPIRIEWLVNGEGDPLKGGLAVSAHIEDEPTPPDGYVEVKAYEVQLSAGPGCEPTFEEVTEFETCIYKESWLQRKGYKADKLIRLEVHGESMEPLLWDGDHVTINTEDKHIRAGHVYAFAFNGEYRVKRLEKRLNGDIIVMSDNSEDYKPEIIPANETDMLFIIGRVIDKSGRGGL